jgi:hypothetical protein
MKEGISSDGLAPLLFEDALLGQITYNGIEECSLTNIKARHS